MMNDKISKENSGHLMTVNGWSQPLEETVSLPCILKWRQKTLWVKRAQTDQASILPALENQAWMTKCLARSPVQRVCIDWKLGAPGIRIWAEACAEANKPVFLRMPPHLKDKRQPRSLLWLLKRIIDRSLAGLLLLGLSPLFLLFALFVKVLSPHSSILSSQWSVGQDGRLFRLYQFQTRVANPTGLCVLPQLFNVVRGEMNLIGSKQWLLLSDL